ncbi:hypothetical protein OHA70_14890 [Kribbella sp. NBC_00382]|uniref:hypothetical protein n=1 Tax=Kribbella sp. NBC_00382 TaxID=2975967 RepID=UPI002E1ED6C1
MLALGIVLIVLAVLFGLGVSVSSGGSTTMSVFGVDFGLSVPTLFFLGAAAGIAITLGLWLTKKGLGRGYRRHREVRQLRQKVAAVEPDSSTSAPVEDEPVTPVGRHAADPADLTDSTDPADDEHTRTVELAGEKHVVADGTDSKQLN